VSNAIELPVLIAGERREPTGDVVRLSYESGCEVILAAPSVEDARTVIATPREPLATLSIDDITIFFDLVGQAWSNPENLWRQRALELIPKLTGYAPAFVEWDVNLLGTTLSRAKQYDFLEADLGDPSLLDDWNRTKAIWQRCLPKGLVAHIMVGNVPMASLFTLYRSLATKNVTVTKLPSRDVVTALCFAQCIYDTDPDHPVTKALSTLYWEAGSAFEDEILAASDVVSVWGRAPAVEAIKHRVKYGTDVIEFGPKRSFAVVLPGVEDWQRTGFKAAYDIAAYDQEGCFSLQEVYVSDEDVDPFVCALEEALNTYQQRFPRRPLTVDAEAHIHRARLEAEADGFRVLASEETHWTIVVTDGPTALEEHPLGRFVYVHPFSAIEEVTRLIDRDVQTVAVEPWSDVWTIADSLALSGADRIVPLGRMARFRPGFIHDGFHPMRRMVRWVALERGLEQKYRFMTHSPAEDEERILMGTARSVIEAT
jgi:long-chain-fatty-acyl-CoA reductase